MHDSTGSYGPNDAVSLCLHVFQHGFLGVRRITRPDQDPDCRCACPPAICRCMHMAGDSTGSVIERSISMMSAGMQICSGSTVLTRNLVGQAATYGISKMDMAWGAPRRARTAGRRPVGAPNAARRMQPTSTAGRRAATVWRTNGFYPK